MDKICTQDNKNRANFYLLTKVFFIICNAFMILLFKEKCIHRTLGKYMRYINNNNKAFVPKLWGQLWILNKLIRD